MECETVLTFMYVKRRILNYCWQNPKANKSLQIGGKILHAFLKKKKEFWEIKSLWPQPWFGDLFRSGLPSLKYLFLVPTRNQDCFTWKQLTWIVPCSSIPTGPKCLETLVWRNRWQSLFCTPVLISSLLKYNADARYWNWLGINTVFQMISLLMII